MEDVQEYVTLQVHDAQLGRIEALIERNLARQEAIASDIKSEIREMRGEIKALDAKIDGVEKNLNSKIDGVKNELEAKIDGVMDAIAITNSRIDDLQSRKSNNIALWAIAAAVGICAFQAIVSLISLLK